MRLKDVYLSPDPLFWTREVGGQFSYQARSIGNYIGRELRGLKIETPKYNRILFRPVPEVEFLGRVNSVGVLRIDVLATEQEYLELETPELNPYFAQLIRQGLNHCDRGLGVPIEETHEAVNRFEENGFVNNWIHKRHRFRGTKYQCSLLCAMTLDEFSLRVEIAVGGVVLLNRLVAKTKPDEIFFHKLLGKASFDDSGIQILDRSGKILDVVTNAELSDAYGASREN